MTELGKNWSTKKFPLDQSRGEGGRPYRPLWIRHCQTEKHHTS